LVFGPHKREDYLVNVLPFDYREGDTTVNQEFQDMLGRVFHEDKDAEEKVRAVRQMYGAMLMPLYPHLFMLWGPPGTGKSTVLNIGARLVDRANLCGVPPSEFKDFNMETMAGKLVNLDTDIPFDTPMRDEVVKKIIDRRPFRVRRKNKTDLYVPLPAIHAFGGNDLPHALDGISKAHDRRWTFIGFNAFVPKGSYDREYWDYCFDLCPAGILNFALEGLRDLIAVGGHFLNPMSGKEKLRVWQLKSDIVGQFLEDVSEGLVSDKNSTIELKEGLEMPRSVAWEIFKKWHEEVYSRSPVLGRNVFFERMRQKNLPEKRTRSGRYFEGIGAKVSDGATL
jgi:phage/plasmid-associated DNA primase